MFNALNKDRVEFSKPDAQITACDFDMRKQSFAIGFNNGDTKLLNIKTLSIENVLSNVNDSTVKSVTALNWQLPEHLIVGYSNGTINDFSITDPSNLTTFKPEEFSAPPVAHIKSYIRDSFILSAYNHKDSATVFGYKTGRSEIVSKMNHSAGSILCMTVLEWAQVVITLGSLNNELSIYNYFHGDLLVVLRLNIEKITLQNPLTSIAVLPITKQMKQIFKAPQHEGDIIACGMQNGTILIAYLTLKFDKGKVSAAISPQQLYKTQEMTKESTVGIMVMHIDPVTDNMLVGDSKGNVVMLKDVIRQVLNPNEMKEKSWKLRWFSGSSGEGDIPRVELVDTLPLPDEAQNSSSPEENKQ